ncbi:hypothetical protein H9L39_11810 [Fusarium oxysporum f. sp. albedinis]|nr:hypothetical protein H9L39_11810 [Fusarium oxysporum f. sp. albedinis]
MRRCHWAINDGRITGLPPLESRGTVAVIAIAPTTPYVHTHTYFIPSAELETLTGLLELPRRPPDPLWWTNLGFNTILEYWRSWKARPITKIDKEHLA